MQVPSVSNKHAKLTVDKSGKVSSSLHLHSHANYIFFVKVFVSSLVPNVPVKLNDVEIIEKAPVADRNIMTVGSCSFRFEYLNKSSVSPLQDTNSLPESTKVQIYSCWLELELAIVF